MTAPCARFEVLLTNVVSPLRLDHEALSRAGRRFCDDVQVQGEGVVFQGVPSRRKAAALVRALTASMGVRASAQLRFTLSEPLFSSTGRPWTASRLLALPKYDPTRKIRTSVAQWSDRRAKEFLEVLGTPERKADFSEATEFSLTVSYAGWDEKKDRAIRAAVGRASTGSGCGFGERDASFEFSRLPALRNALRNLSALGFGTRVYLARNLFDAAGGWEDSVDLFSRTTPARALAKIDGCL